MITDEEIADLIDANSSSGCLEDLAVFTFARAIYQLGRQHQRESGDVCSGCAVMKAANTYGRVPISGGAAGSGFIAYGAGGSAPMLAGKGVV